MNDFTYYKPIIKKVINSDDGDKLISELGHIALMCPNCFYTIKFPICYTKHMEGILNKINDFTTNNEYNGQCINCKEDVNFIEIDINMAKIISILNMKGYYTAFCCEGHIQPDIITGDEEVSFPYIYFYFWDDINILNTNPLPDTWYINPINEKTKIFTIEDHISEEAPESIEDITEYIKWIKNNWDHKKRIKDIYNWAEGLPYKDKHTKLLQNLIINEPNATKLILRANAERKIKYNELIDEGNTDIK